MCYSYFSGKGKTPTGRGVGCRVSCCMRARRGLLGQLLYACESRVTFLGVHPTGRVLQWVRVVTGVAIDVWVEGAGV